MVTFGNHQRNGAKLINPFSTVSNIAYVIAGALLLPVHWVLGALLILLGVASTGFHWTRSDCWHKFDIVMIYYVFAVIGSWIFWSDLGIVIGLGVGAVCHWSFRLFSDYSRYIIGVLGVFCLIGLGLNAEARQVFNVVFVFGLAFMCSAIADHIEDERSMLYDHAHSAWHWFTAIGIYYLIAYI